MDQKTYDDVMRVLEKNGYSSPPIVTGVENGPEREIIIRYSCPPDYDDQDEIARIINLSLNTLGVEVNSYGVKQQDIPPNDVPWSTFKADIICGMPNNEDREELITLLNDEIEKLERYVHEEYQLPE